MAACTFANKSDFRVLPQAPIEAALPAKLALSVMPGRAARVCRTLHTTRVRFRRLNKTASALEQSGWNAAPRVPRLRPQFYGVRPRQLRPSNLFYTMICFPSPRMYPDGR